MAKKVAKKTKLISKETAKEQQKSISKNTFTVNGKKYRFAVFQYINSKAVTVKVVDALKNPAELERLVSIESGVIEAV